MIDVDRFIRSSEDLWHRMRYQKSLEWIGSLAELRVLEFGRSSSFTDILLDQFPQATVENTGEQDLRFPLSNESATYDAILCMEVLEHLSDTPCGEIDKISTFDYSGMRTALGEAARLLRPGGSLFLSTPNVCSYTSLFNLLQNRHPFSYDPHAREVSVADVRRLITESGLTVDRLETVVVWDWHKIGPDKIRMMEFLLDQCGLSKENRGDCIFARATR